jgi:hypothetical protein
MIKKNKIILFTLSGALIIVGCLSVILFYNHVKQPYAPVIKAIPQNAAVIIITHSPQQTWAHLSQSVIWKGLLGIEQMADINKEIRFVDSASARNAKLKELFKKNPLYLSIHPDIKGGCDFLFSINVNSNRQQIYIRSLIQEISANTSAFIPRKFDGATIYKVIIKGYDHVFSYAVHKGVLVFSFNPNIVLAAISQLESKSAIDDDKSFKQLLATAGKKTDANIYLNYKYLAKIIQNQTLPAHKTNIGLLSSFAQWVELDLMVKEDKFLFSGFSSVNEKDNQFLKLFSNQQPRKSKLAAVLPENTNVFLDFTFSDFQSYFSSYKSFLQKTGRIIPYKIRINSLNKAYYMDFEKSFVNLVGSEVALAVIESGPDIKENTFVLIQTSDSVSKNLSLLEFSKAINRLSASEGEVHDYNGYKIRHFNVPDVLPLFFGPLFQKLTDNYFTIIGNTIIFGNSVPSIKNFVNYYKSGKTLEKSPQYKSFTDNIDEKSNILFYSNVGSSLNFIKSYLNNYNAANFESNYGIFSNFNGFAIQFKSSGNWFYTTGCIKYKSRQKEEFSALWQVPLDAKLMGSPFIFKDIANNSMKIIAFDYANNMYQIDKDGEIEWKIKLKEKNNSPVYSVDNVKTRKQQYVFSTQNYFYKIDFDGKLAEGFPVKFKSEATNGISLIGNESKGNCQFIIASQNHKIYNYDIDGNLNKKWAAPVSGFLINKQVLPFTYRGKSHLLFTNNEEKLLITDLNGKTEIMVNTLEGKSSNTEYYVNKTNNLSPIISTDTAGNILYINPWEKTVKKSFQKFSFSHYFLYNDFDGDKSNDFLFVDKDHLFVFNKNGKQIFDFPFDFEVNVEPVINYIPKIGNIFGIFDEYDQEIYLFDKNGRISPDIKFLGETPFVTGSLTENGSLNLIVGYENSLLNYQVK